ncbi:MAG: M23 family peptidase [Deltaproteobacteria bacterium]|nr:MAG: M23 family peptidase [Deltaproteobacteria bacterium]
MKRVWVTGAVILVLLLAGVIFFAPPFERTSPEVKLPPEGYIGAKAVLQIRAKDRRSGLKEVVVDLVQRGRRWTVYRKAFPRGIHEVEISLEIEPKKLGVMEGSCVLEVRATDRSLWRFGHGNVEVAEGKFVVDWTPPRVELLGNTRYVYLNGAGAALFRTSEDAFEAYAQVGELLFRAYKKKDRRGFLWAVLFGVPQYAKGREVRLTVKDRAGNARTLLLPVHIVPRKVVRERVSLSEGFLRKKVYPLLPPERQDLPPEEAFRAVNEIMRSRDDAEITRIASSSSPLPLWEGAFSQMKNTEVTATFGDQRTYFYRGKMVGRSVHLGCDLASVAHAPVPASNRGRVIYTGPMGIYGNVVILDHGLGLASLYAHLSHCTVKEGEEVKKGQVIGYTDTTGLAGGDHLHFAILLSGHPVNPIEWWDGKWLRERIVAVLSPFLGEGAKASEEAPSKAEGRRP